MADITKTIGTNSRDYTTIQDWINDLSDTGIYTASDNAIGVCYNDSVFLEEDLAVASSLPNSITLTVASGDRHTGKPFTGARIESSGLGNNILNTANGDGDPPIIIEWLELHLIDIPDHEYDLIKHNPSATNTDYLSTFRNLICGASAASGTINAVRGIWSDDAISVYNCMVYDIYGFVDPGDTNYIVGIGGTSRMNISNCTVYNIQGGGDFVYGFGRNFSANTTLQNCIAMNVSNTGAGVAVCIQGSLGTYNNNLTSDDSGSGITGLLADDQFVSIVVGDIDLHLKSTSTAIGSGLDLGSGLFSIDIDNFDRHENNVIWDIGADQYVVSSYFRGMFFNSLVGL